MAGLNERVSQISLTLLAFLLGFLIMTQTHTQRLVSKARASGSSAEQSVILSSLVEANAGLREEVGSLEAQLDDYRRVGSSGLLEALVEELNRIKMVNGLVEVSGPGIEVRIQGPLNALNVQDLSNELRNAGAEAIALNGQRLAYWSAMAVDENGWLVIDGVRVASPYLFQAIGNAETLEVALLRSGGMIAVLEHTYDGFEVQLHRRSRLVLPVHRQPLEFRYTSLEE